MSGPIVVIVAGVVTTWIAFSGADGLVADDYYKRGLAVNVVLEREQNAVRRGITAQLERGPDRISVRLTGAEPPALFLHLAHATRSSFDLRLRLERGADGVYRTALPPLAAGRWRAVLEDPKGEWRIVRESL